MVNCFFLACFQVASQTRLRVESTLAAMKRIFLAAGLLVLSLTTGQASPTSALGMPTKSTPAGNPETPLNKNIPTYEATLGGPIVKDKLWFYAGLGYTKNSYSRDAIFYSDPSKTNRTFDWWNDAKYYNYNISTQLSNSMRLKFTGSNQRNGNRGTAPTTARSAYSTSSAASMRTSTYMGRTSNMGSGRARRDLGNRRNCFGMSAQWAAATPSVAGNSKQA